MLIEGGTYSGERPLYNLRDAHLCRVVTGEGESAIKEGKNIVAEKCRFEGKYVCWEIEGLEVKDCTFAETARASLWYVQNLKMTNCQIDAPKCFRHVTGAELNNLVLTNGVDSLLHCSDVVIRGMQLQGNYPLQYVRNIEIHNAKIAGRDVLWESDKCTVYDSELDGAYLGWYSRNLKLVRCHISGTQPLCYAENLVLEDCIFAPDADRALEKTSVQVTTGKDLKQILDTHPDLKARLELRLKRIAELNPSLETNPVRTLDDLYKWFQHFLTCLPWDGLNLPDRSVFRRIDQSIGYAYYLFGNLQYELEINEWLIAYDTAWGIWLRSENSWNMACLELATTDARFELNTGKYEDPNNWYCWNDFFCRRLAPGKPFVGQTIAEGIVAPSEGELQDGPIKTMDHYAWADLLGDSPYKEHFASAQAVHLSLDMYHYHRLHAPIDGEVLDLRIIPGMHLDGGEIIWDETQNRYRYANSNNTDFQALETRGVMVIGRSGRPVVAIVAVGVAQVSSVNWNKEFQVGAHITQGQEIGFFACGGSDVVVMW